ncbi:MULTISPECIES: spore coat U domain-containing protein [Paraburkholderia]|uniref:Csu type fimbrial protein n=1 Tax=Paraburkholderia TaxID=1822464 RepID=UPI00224E30E6|nr:MULTISPECIES: spore coat U domain-containing protein [Paraburkholderia]MCX4161730.1 spore coat U domain-containing protein [Paraburkholderia megapolitana]MDN7157227.1 spore coat U domain-containing protein [Paraburkholderia sp. CHISQ3]MDQ6494272.1 spore coat U domain-containing protein [Paraburkholderia megapolitana]
MNTFSRRLKCCVIAGTAGLFFCFGSLDAQAQCSVSRTPISASFGQVASFAVRTVLQSSSTTNSGLSCRGAIVDQTTETAINMTSSSENSGSLKNSAGDTIPYQIYADADAAIPINRGRVNWASGRLRSALNNIFGGSSRSLPLFFRTVPGANVTAGTYTDTIILNWDWNYCRSHSVLSLIGRVPCSSPEEGSGTSTIALTLVVTNDCAIAARDISFGAAQDPASFSPVTGGIGVTCTKGLTYTVGIGSGSFPAANGRRQMASSGGGRLQYDIFSGGGATVWGRDTNRVNSVSAADGLSAQQFPFRAAIYADQDTPPVGTYTDSVVIDVRY